MTIDNINDYYELKPQSRARIVSWFNNTANLICDLRATENIEDEHIVKLLRSVITQKNLKLLIGE